MNKHLNLFKFYASSDREYQLENDLTRALAITLMENNLFLHETLKEILEESDFNALLNQDLSQSALDISIQIDTKNLKNCEKVYAVSISDFPLNIENFYGLGNGYEKTEITDLVIQLNAIDETPNKKITIIFEVKRNNVNTAQQLFNQLFPFLEIMTQILIFKILTKKNILLLVIGIGKK